MMKLIFWLSLLANVIFIAFLRWGDVLQSDSSAAHPRPPLNPEKITLRKKPPETVPISVPPPASVPPIIQLAASSPAPVDSNLTSSNLCLEWGEFSGSDLSRASAALEQLNLENKAIQKQVEYEIGYWVYMPPRRNRAQVDKKISELKNLGINEFYVVQEAGKWNNSISLGIFKAETAAQKHLEKLRERGVRSALVGKRPSKLLFTVFALNNLNPEIVAKLEELKNGFQESELKAVECSPSQ